MRSPLDRPLPQFAGAGGGPSAGKFLSGDAQHQGTVSLATYALLFAEVVRYEQNRVATVTELQNKLSSLGRSVGSRLLDAVMARERAAGRREHRLLNMLMFVKTNVWRTLFGREADKLERSNDNPGTYLLIEREPLVNTFVSVPKDKGSLNCASFIAGILEAVLCDSNFRCKVTAHWHVGTTYMIQFDDEVVEREKLLEASR